MSDLAGLSGGEAAAGGLGLIATVGGLIAWMMRSMTARQEAADKRESALRETVQASFDSKDSIIKENYSRIFKMLEEDVKTLKESNINLERRLSRIEGTKTDA